MSSLGGFEVSVVRPFQPSLRRWRRFKAANKIGARVFVLSVLFLFFVCSPFLLDHHEDEDDDDDDRSLCFVLWSIEYHAMDRVNFFLSIFLMNPSPLSHFTLSFMI